jgi:hypothetical protein
MSIAVRVSPVQTPAGQAALREPPHFGNSRQVLTRGERVHS